MHHNALSEIMVVLSLSPVAFVFLCVQWYRGIFDDMHHMSLAS